jgi:hypothetical protein
MDLIHRLRTWDSPAAALTVGLKMAPSKKVWSEIVGPIRWSEMVDPNGSSKSLVQTVWSSAVIILGSPTRSARLTRTGHLVSVRQL